MTGMIDLVVRTLVVAALLFACAVAVTGWAIRTRRLNPFGAWARLVRRVSDPVLRMIERRIVRAGGSPHDAPLWLIGIVIVGGLVLLTVIRWLIGTIGRLDYLADAGPSAWLRVLVNAAFNVTMAALFIRVIGSWFGLSRYRRWMRPVYVMTDWIVEPIRRVLPSVGMFDFSPMLAWLVLLVLRGFILGML